MQQPGQAPLRFGIITDIHHAPETGDGGSVSTAIDLARCSTYWQTADLKFVLQLGDLISREGPESESDLLTIRTMLDRYPGRMLHVIGNHCLAVPLKRFISIMGLPAPYYSFTEGGIRFIVLHSMDVSVLSEPDNDSDRQTLRHYRDEKRALPYCGAVGRRQLEWLAKELDRSAEEHEPVVLFCHLPLLEETTDAIHGLLWNHEELCTLLFRYHHVRACFSGHYHPGGYASRHGIHFFVMPGFIRRNEPGSVSCGMVEIGGGRLRINSMDNRELCNFDFT
jgi:manganese-dependent ADP-ribose/CDP-alcohol diphosphatase